MNGKYQWCGDVAVGVSDAWRRRADREEATKGGNLSQTNMN